jgi:NADPH-dependent curcumin reductase CurA
MPVHEALPGEESVLKAISRWFRTENPAETDEKGEARMPATAHHWYFNKRPKDVIEDDTLVLREDPIPALKDGEILIRTLYMSLDATNRVWMSDWDTYMAPLPLGSRMLGFILGEVAESRNAAFPQGSLVTGLGTWSDWIVTDGEGYAPFPRPEGVALSDAFGILAVAGPTAYVGIHEIGKPKPGDTVVVTAAAGAVGALAGQIAKLHGCRVVGVAGSDDKCKWLTDELGFDAAINYRKENLLEALRREAPNGIDVQFENVGGDQLDAALTLMNNGGRVVICGLISTYNSSDPVPGPYMFRNVIMKRLTIQGFVILDYAAHFPEYHAKLVEWMRSGDLKYRIHIEDGIGNAVAALRLLYTGGNNGKLMVRIGKEGM